MRLSSFAISAMLVAFAANGIDAQIPISAYTGSFSVSTATRGYYFQTPVAMVVSALQVPDEMRAGMQLVALYKMNAAPPQYSASVPVTPVFFAATTNNDIIPVVPPAAFMPGDWVGVLGGAGAANATVHSSYGVGNFTSHVLGQPITLLRFLMQTNIGNNLGVGNVSAEGTASIARVRMFVVGQGEARTYGSSSGSGSLVVADPFPPSINYNGEFRIMSTSATNQGGVLAVGASRGSLSTPFGTLLIGLPILLTLPVAGPIPSTGTPLTLAIPNDTSLLNAVLTFQAGVVDAGALTLSNGLQWTVGQ